MDPDEVAVGIIAGLLEAQTGQKMTQDRRWRIRSALGGIFRDRGISSNQDLVVLLTQPDQSTLAREVVEALLNNETYFFRDRLVFETLAQKVLPELARQRQAQRSLSIWSCGCSTGQEVLSLAMMFTEQRHRWDGWNIQILGTDVSSSVVNHARKGLYSQFQIQRGLGVSQMLGFFTEKEEGWVAGEQLRKMIRFERHNMLDPPPYPGTFDLILCRNVMLYFDQETRQRAVKRLHEASPADGWLLLGGGEGAVSDNSLFTPSEHLVSLFRTAGKGDDTRNQASSAPSEAA
ncbi:CheR family methyltransferase [Alteraurantiacibacter aquimixticola]|nr:protein-glutamate O-methyltransferase CheR [Alteraurantiacibacter aquimixticola]